MMSQQVTVTATRWKFGWELELDRGGVTQVRALGRAAQQVRDYLDTVDPDADHSDWVINVVPEIGPLYAEARQAKAEADAAASATLAAARRMRRAVRDLRGSGLSVSDTATVLGLSRGRVSQLSRDLADAA
jgi:DNA-directed RNA polymerase specialized sigma24 family protein